MNIDEPKLKKVVEALGWLQQAEKHYRWLQYIIADDCVKKAQSALADDCFKRQPIPGFSRSQQPETVKIKASTPLGYAIVNGADFDPESMELFKEPQVTKKRS